MLRTPSLRLSAREPRGPSLMTIALAVFDTWRRRFPRSQIDQKFVLDLTSHFSYPNVFFKKCIDLGQVIIAELAV